MVTGKLYIQGHATMAAPSQDSLQLIKETAEHLNNILGQEAEHIANVAYTLYEHYDALITLDRTQYVQARNKLWFSNPRAVGPKTIVENGHIQEQWFTAQARAKDYITQEWQRNLDEINSSMSEIFKRTSDSALTCITTDADVKKLFNAFINAVTQQRNYTYEKTQEDLKTVSTITGQSREACKGEFRKFIAALENIGITSPA